jgi:hypothetical protein
MTSQLEALSQEEIMARLLRLERLKENWRRAALAWKKKPENRQTVLSQRRAHYARKRLDPQWMARQCVRTKESRRRQREAACISARV